MRYTVGLSGVIDTAVLPAAPLPPQPLPMCALGFLVMRYVMEQGQEAMDEEGCGPLYAALRWPQERIMS
jgi:hypothetical protein